MFDIDVGSSLGKDENIWTFLTNAWDTFLGLIKSFQVTDALDIILVSFILYNAIKLVRETRAEQLIKGLLIL